MRCSPRTPWRACTSTASTTPRSTRPNRRRPTARKDGEPLAIVARRLA
nr:MAG TPA: hypothetical protein [Caudoviricetes sp.]